MVSPTNIRSRGFSAARATAAWAAAPAKRCATWSAASSCATWTSRPVCWAWGCSSSKKIPDEPGIFCAANLIRRFRPQIFFAVHRVDLEFPDLGALEHVQHDIGTRVAARPQLAVKIAVPFDLLAANADDNVAARQPRLVGRTVGRHARDDQLALQVLGVDAKPRPRLGRRAPLRNQVAEYRVQ